LYEVRKPEAVPVKDAGLRRALFAATCFFRAVAENQPGENKNRMGHTTTFSGLAARVRGFIAACAKDWEGTAGRDARLTRRQDACVTSEADFNALALELFGLQYAHNAAYRRFCEARGARPGRIEDWRGIPAIPTAAFKECDMSCLPHDQRGTVFYSSGTTGQRPSRHFHNAESLALYEASLLAWFGVNVFRDKLKLELQTQPFQFGVQALACSPGQPITNPKRMIFLTPPGRLAPHSSLVHMFETLQRELGSADSIFLGGVLEDGAWTLDLEAASDALRIGAQEGHALMVLGTAFSFVHLLDYFEVRKLQLDLPSGSIALETGGYKSRSRALPKTELHSLISRRLGISHANIICEYGMSELGSQAYDRVFPETRNTQHGIRIFNFPPWCRVQVISPETGLEVSEGETGLIRVFDLANVYSVMAVQTADLAIRRGDGFELIGRAELAEPRGCSLMVVESFGQ
jgi:hypothetical protein